MNWSILLSIENTSLPTVFGKRKCCFRMSENVERKIVGTLQTVLGGFAKGRTEEAFFTGEQAGGADTAELFLLLGDLLPERDDQLFGAKLVKQTGLWSLTPSRQTERQMENRSLGGGNLRN
jgi:hypothetical protein